MQRLARFMLLFLMINCAHITNKNTKYQKVDGIIFLEDDEEEKPAKASKSSKSSIQSANPKSQDTKQENPKDVRNFKDMDGIILLDFEDQINETPRQPFKPNHKKLQTGKASYYAIGLKGNKTASGERYDPYKLTAAHPSLPFGTNVRVTNLYNNASVIVRINDRGPRAKSRIIDLSYAAAQKLDLISAGVAEVAIEVLSNNQLREKEFEF